MKGNRVINFLIAIFFILIILYERPTVAEDSLSFKNSDTQQQSNNDSESTQTPQKKKK